MISDPMLELEYHSGMTQEMGIFGRYIDAECNSVISRIFSLCWICPGAAKA